MPHSTCAACKAGFYSAATTAHLTKDVCPECGSLLQPAGERPEPLIVFESTLADRVGHLIARREVFRAQARVDAEGWADDAGTLAVEPTAPVPL